jgi:hypothetical protein
MQTAWLDRSVGLRQLYFASETLLHLTLMVEAASLQEDNVNSIRCELKRTCDPSGTSTDDAHIAGDLGSSWHPSAINEHWLSPGKSSCGRSLAWGS